MLNSGIFDAVIGVLFLFLLVATICTSVREGLEAFLGWRARYLEFAIYQMLRDRVPQAETAVGEADTGKSTMAKSFFEHPLIFGLYKGTYAFPDRMTKPKLLSLRPNLPSYIPSKAFASAVLDVIVHQAGTSPSKQAGPIQFDQLRETVEKLVEYPQVQRAVLTAIDSSTGSLESVRINLEAWFDGVMDRVSG